MQRPSLVRQVKYLSTASRWRGPDCTATAAYRPELLNGLVTLTVLATQVDATSSTQTMPQTLTASPYYDWANRGEGNRTVWFPAY
jgi:hypothetical protein